MALSDNIRLARKKSGFSKTEVAEELGVSKQEIFDWETGKAEPSAETLLKLAHFLNTDVRVLVGAEDRRFTSREAIMQQGMRTVLSRQNAVLLTAFCTCMMMIFCVNPGKADAFKYLLGICGALSFLMLIARIWLTTSKKLRGKLTVRVSVFALIFTALILVLNRFVGGLIAIVCGILFLVLLLKVGEDPKKVSL